LSNKQVPPEHYPRNVHYSIEDHSAKKHVLHINEYRNNEF